MLASIETLCKRLNDLSFDMVANELNYSEFNMLFDAYVNMKYSEVSEVRELWAKNFYANETLRRAFEQRELTEINYEEA